MTATEADTILPLAQEVYPATSVNDQNPMRTARIDTSTLISLLSKLDIMALGKAILLTAMFVLAFKLAWLLSKPKYYRRKRFSVTPWLAEVLPASWDDPDHSSPLFRSEDALGLVLRSLSQAAARYGTRREEGKEQAPLTSTWSVADSS
ncbi:hypothetical protein O3P69_000239 [Scylla paramamosain]|uniref:Uncharacterized protein n=2 Tax=Scylla paramamosain TaxID=85552 RepID=A0AAW0UZE2_SCYPA